jgi:hypothetical protein
MITLAYPHSRGDVESAVEGLADINLQKRAWIERRPRPSGECPRFVDAIHWLFDDSGLADGPYTCIGYILYDDQEAESLVGLMKQLVDLLNKYGKSKPFTIYFNTPEWPAIVATANDCLRLLTLNNSKSAPLSTHD